MEPAAKALGYLLCVTVPLGLAVVAFPWLSEAVIAFLCPSYHLV